jgi:hypothetical protein
MTRKMTKSEWLEANGFSDFGVTYLVLGNSYPIKEDLKENGFKYSPLLRWHGDNDDLDLPADCSYYELRYEDIFTWDEASQTTFMKEGVRDKLELIFNPPIESNSQFVGEIGERLRDIPMRVCNIGGFDSAYGYKWVYTFEDIDGNVYSWFTTSQQAICIGMTYIVTGTIKAHVEYKKVFTTQLSRCVIKEA